jgi:hypothetical protein
MSGNLTKLALGVGITTIGIVGFAGVASAHDATVNLTGKHCTDTGAYTGTLTITPTNLELHPVADIENSGHYQVSTFPYVHQLVTDSSTTYSVNVTWNDGFHVGPKVVTLTMPDGGCGPVQTVPPPTVPTSPPPAQIVTAPPTTPVPTPDVPTTVKVCTDGQPPSVPVEDGSVVCPEFFPPTTAVATAVTVKPKMVQPITLPTTGAPTVPIVGAALALIFAGSTMLFVRKRASD